MKTSKHATCSRVRAGRAAGNTPDTGVATTETSPTVLPANLFSSWPS
ncbi:MAG: hypothetical protein WCS31_04135 [Verrucomicrobiae bacterium]